MAWHGNDAKVAVAEDAAGKPVTVSFLTVRQLQSEAAAAQEAVVAQAAPADHRAAGAEAREAPHACLDSSCLLAIHALERL